MVLLILVFVGLMSVWPLLVLGTVVMAATAQFARGPLRGFAFVAAIVLGIPSLLGGIFVLGKVWEAHVIRANEQAAVYGR